MTTINEAGLAILILCIGVPVIDVAYRLAYSRNRRKRDRALRKALRKQTS